MLELKTFVQVQTFRRGPFVPSPPYPVSAIHTRHLVVSLDWFYCFHCFSFFFCKHFWKYTFSLYYQYWNVWRHQQYGVSISLLPHLLTCLSFSNQSLIKFSYVPFFASPISFAILPLLLRPNIRTNSHMFLFLRLPYYPLLPLTFTMFSLFCTILSRKTAHTPYPVSTWLCVLVVTIYISQNYYVLFTVKHAVIFSTCPT